MHLTVHLKYYVPVLISLVWHNPISILTMQKDTINVELPGIKDKERVRKYLQSTANLQFWEVYTLQDANYGSGWQRFIDAFNIKYGGAKDTTVKTDSVNNLIVQRMLIAKC